MSPSPISQLVSTKPLDGLARAFFGPSHGTRELTSQIDTPRNIFISNGHLLGKFLASNNVISDPKDVMFTFATFIKMV